MKQSWYEPTLLVSNIQKNNLIVQISRIADFLFSCSDCPRSNISPSRTDIVNLLPKWQFLQSSHSHRGHKSYLASGPFLNPVYFPNERENLNEPVLPLVLPLSPPHINFSLFPAILEYRLWWRGKAGLRKSSRRQKQNLQVPAFPRPGELVSSYSNLRQP